MTSPDTITVGIDNEVLILTIDRPKARNAVDGPTATQLREAFEEFEGNSDLSIAILTGAGGNFCAGADLKAISTGRGNRVEADMSLPGPMGPTRMELSKPVIAAVEGFAVAGGLELAAWCDLRVAAQDATFGVYCRRWGVPLVDGGTVRLPRLIGHSRAMDMILTGRGVKASEALEMGLANRVCPTGEALATAIDLAHEVAAFPQSCMRSDRNSATGQWSLNEAEAMAAETRVGLETIATGETREGASRFAAGEGRSGSGV